MISSLVRRVLYASNLAIFSRRNNLHEIEFQSQKTVTKTSVWGIQNRLSFPSTKIKLINFTKKKRGLSNMRIVLNDEEIS